MMLQQTVQKVSKRKPVRDVKPALEDIIFDIEWAPIAKRYFGKSPSWIYNKLKCKDGNGGIGGFTDEETENLRSALCDFAERLRNAAAKL